MFIDITEKDKKEYNDAVSHPLQSYEWGEFREKTGIKVVRRGKKEKDGFITAYSMTIHPVPGLPYTIGYIPKGPLPTNEFLEDVKETGRKEKCVYVQLEPDVTAEDGKPEIERIVLDKKLRLKPSFHPLFTKYTFVLDITKSEEELLKNMHPKTRYNIRVAEKHGVKIEEDNSEKGFDDFMKLYEETTTRQKFYAHTPKYHKLLWETLQIRNSKYSTASQAEIRNSLQYSLLHALYEPEASSQKPVAETLVSWVLFSFHNHLYYPYGASSREHRETMSNNLIMWEAIKFGKKLGLKYFDMWGALGPNPDEKDPWYGFHKFKQGYGAKLTEFVGSYDLVINPMMYEVVKVGDSLRWALLNLKKKL